jgi:hypothetical protein
MRLKTILVTVAVLAVLSIGAFIVRRPAPPAITDARLNQPLVAADAIEKATKLRLSDAGKTVELTRQADGTWRVPSYYDMQADFNKLSGLVGNLTQAKIQRLVTSNPERIARLEFKDTKIELLNASDQVVFTATLGRNAETGGGRFVRFGDESKAYLTNLSAWLDPEAKNWANAELLNVKADEIAKVEIPFSEGGSVTVSRAKKEDPWTAENPPAGQTLKADRVASLLSSVASLRFSETSALDDPNLAAAKANLRPIKLTTFDHKTITVALGRKPEEKKLKPLTATPDKSGPGALGNLADLAKQPARKEGEPAAEGANPLAPEFETIPAGPVYAVVSHSEASAPVNALMQKRGFQIAEYTFTGLPQKADELFEPAPPAQP